MPSHADGRAAAVRDADAAASKLAATDLKAQFAAERARDILPGDDTMASYG